MKLTKKEKAALQKEAEKIIVDVLAYLDMNCYEPVAVTIAFRILTKNATKILKKLEAAK